MKHSQFIRHILIPRLNDIGNRLNCKASEYAKDGNIFHNFIQGAQFDSITPKRCLWDYMRKQLISIKDLVDDNKKATPKLVDEKIGDVICYLILLEGIIKHTEFDQLPDTNTLITHKP